jgi:hypothetical protein
MPTANYNQESHDATESCPFCTIASAYPSSTTSAASSAAQSVKELQSAVPNDAEFTKVSPSCFLVLSAPRVMAFLDILPMTRGHLLVTVRGHREKVQDLEGGEGSEIGAFSISFVMLMGGEVFWHVMVMCGELVLTFGAGFWLPVLAKVVARVTGTTDYNLVQNNGMFDISEPLEISLLHHRLTSRIKILTWDLTIGAGTNC